MPLQFGSASLAEDMQTSSASAGDLKILTPGIVSCSPPLQLKLNCMEPAEITVALHNVLFRSTICAVGAPPTALCRLS